jgi:hypothetical protein
MGVATPLRECCGTKEFGGRVQTGRRSRPSESWPPGGSALAGVRDAPVEVHGMDESSRRLERRLEGPLLIFALLTVPAIAIENSSVGEPWDTIGAVLNWSIWLAFVGEILLMLRVVPHRGRWLRDHPLDLAIVVFTPPFLPASLRRHGCSACCDWSGS